MDYTFRLSQSALSDASVTATDCLNVLAASLATARQAIAGSAYGMIVSPPLTMIVAPVMKLESGPARNTTVRPMSCSASPSRRSGR